MASSEKPHDDDLSDTALLERYVAERDEAAFAALVRRHHGLVFGVCQRRLRCRQDAEDAFQATFLVLAEKGHKIRRRGSLASWLYGVAYRVALGLSRQRAARVTVSFQEPVMVHNDPLQILAERHEQLVTDEELAALPERLRAPLVLRYLAGKTNAQVADQLGISVAAVESRLRRAKRKLRRTLTRRGIALSTTLVSVGAAHTPSAHAAESLVAETVAVCLGGSSAATASGSIEVSQTVLKLARKEVHAMTTLKLSNVAAVAVAIICTASLGFGLRQALSQSPENQAGLRLAAVETGDAASAGEAGEVTVAEPTLDNAARVEQARAMVQAAEDAYQAYKIGYELRNVPMDNVYLWSQRWLDAELVLIDQESPGNDEEVKERRAEVFQQHLVRMEQLHEKVAELYKADAIGWEAFSYHATRYFVAEAKLWVENARRDRPAR